MHAHDVNDYIKAAAGEQFSAKDFRTWSGTVLAADALAEHDPVPESRTGRRRAVVDAVATVAEQLGNTPAVSRSAYIDPRVVESFEDGDTIGVRLGRGSDGALLGRRQQGSAGSRAVEEAVIDLLDVTTHRPRRGNDDLTGFPALQLLLRGTFPVPGGWEPCGGRSGPLPRPSPPTAAAAEWVGPPEPIVMVRCPCQVGRNQPVDAARSCQTGFQARRNSFCRRRCSPANSPAV